MRPNKYSTLHRSRTYIVVPRDVPPENFLSVPETQKERKPSLVRCVLIPVLVLLVIAVLLSGLVCLVYGYHSRQEAVQWTGGDRDDPEEQGDDEHQGDTKHQGDEPSAAYEYTQLIVDHNRTLYLRKPVSSSSCSSSPCLGGGSCESHDGTFTCYCTVGRWGQYCEKVVSSSPRGRMGGQFSGQSYVKVKSVGTVGPRTSITVKFRPVERDGVMMFSYLDSGNISLSLVGGHVQFRYHLGGDHLVLQSPYQVTLKYWHNLILQTYHADVMLKLDTQEPILGSLQGGKLAGLGSEVFIGGVYQSGMELGFQGCLKGVKFGHQTFSLVSELEPLLIEQRGVEECGGGEEKVGG